MDNLINITRKICGCVKDSGHSQASRSNIAKNIPLTEQKLISYLYEVRLLNSLNTKATSQTDQIDILSSGSSFK